MGEIVSAAFYSSVFDEDNTDLFELISHHSRWCCGSSWINTTVNTDVFTCVDTDVLTWNWGGAGVGDQAYFLLGWQINRMCQQMLNEKNNNNKKKNPIWYFGSAASDSWSFLFSRVKKEYRMKTAPLSGYLSVKILPVIKLWTDSIFTILNKTHTQGIKGNYWTWNTKPQQAKVVSMVFRVMSTKTLINSMPNYWFSKRGINISFLQRQTWKSEFTKSQGRSLLQRKESRYSEIRGKTERLFFSPRANKSSLWPDFKWVNLYNHICCEGHFIWSPCVSFSLLTDYLSSPL